MSILKFAILQTNPYWENKEKNFEKLDSILSNISENVDIVVLPEMFSTGFTMDSKTYADQNAEETIMWMSEKSVKYNFAICGSIIAKSEDKYYNRFLFVNKDNVDFYDKRHLFRMGDEHLHFSAGNNRVIVDFKGVKILLQVCYDLRFPVFSRNKNQYDIAIYTANWPASRRQVWDILLKARAIENQAIMVACNRVGTDGRDLVYNGGSQVVNERGEQTILAKDNTEEIVEFTIDTSSIKEFREKFPTYLDADEFTLA